MHRLLTLLLTLFFAGFAPASAAPAQSLHERLDDEAYLRGLIEMGLPEVLEHYLQTTPPDDAIVDAQARIALARLRLDDPHLPPAQREVLRDEVLQRRRALIDAHPDDPRVGEWRLDQAQDLLFQRFFADGLHLTVALGVPMRSQRHDAAELAERMNLLTMLAELDIETAILDLEAAPDYAENLERQLERRRLATEQRDRRLPFLRGVAAYLHATLNAADDVERREGYELAADALERALRTLQGEMALHAHAFAGLTLLKLGQAGTARPHFDAVLDADEAPRWLTFTGSVGRIMVDAREGRETEALQALKQMQQRYGSADDLFYRLLLTDRAFLVRLDLARASGEGRRAARLAEAYAVYTDLLDEDLGLPPVRHRRLVLERLAAVIDPDATVDGLPPIAQVAIADRWADDASTIGRAVNRLQALVARGDLDDATRSVAELTLARALRQAGRRVAAAQQLLAFAQHDPAAAEAPAAVEEAATLALRAADADAGDADAHTVAMQAVDRLLTRYGGGSSPDEWRYAAGRLVLKDGRVDEAVRHFESVEPGSPRHVDARFMIASARRRALHAATEAASDQRSAAQRLRQAAEAASAVIAAALHDADAGAGDERAVALREYRAWTAVFLAEAHLALNDAQAAVSVLEAADDTGAALRPKVAAAVLRSRIDALRAAGRFDEALQAVRTFLDHAPEEALRVVPSLLTALAERHRELLDAGREADARTLAHDTMAPLAQLADEWLTRHGTPDGVEAGAQRIATRLAVADAHRLAGRCDRALVLYNDLLRAQPNAAPLLAGKADCLYRLGGDDRLGEAMLIFRQIVNAGPDIVGEDVYWLAELRSLQILDAVGRNTRKIVPRIEQLRQRDASLGGSWYRREFEKLQLRHGAR